MLAVLLVAVLAAAAAAVVRYWFLPNIDHYRNEIASVASEAAGHPITIGAIHAGWEGWHPHFSLRDVRLHDAAGEPALILNRVESAVQWRALLTGEARLHRLELFEPRLEIRRDRDRVIYVAGIAVKTSQEERGFSDWLLQQRDVAVHNAVLVWQDDQRSADPLVLDQVNLHLRNAGASHRFELSAHPPAELASPFQIAGEVKGRSPYRGEVQVQFERVDLAALRPWVNAPIMLDRGTGGLRLSFAFRDKLLTEGIAEFKLANIKAQFEKSLPELDLAGLQGKLNWKRLPHGHEIAASNLAFAARDGSTHPATDFFLLFREAHDGDPARAELRLSRLEIAPAVALMQRLPLEEHWRQWLSALSPRGAAEDLALKWSGEWPKLASYSGRARIAGASWRAHGAIPGAQNLTAKMEASDKGGVASVECRSCGVDLPKVFVAPLGFDSLAAKVDWTQDSQGFGLRLEHLTFANSHAAGNAQGSYRSEGKGSIDMNGSLARADASQVWRYLPITLKQQVRDWVQAALQAGRATSAKFRVNGTVADFPYGDDRPGVFEVRIHGQEGTLKYANGWPQVEILDADIVFQNRSMRVRSNNARMLGARLSDVSIAISDIGHRNPTLQITGQAQGRSGEFLEFIAQSPVSKMIDHVTREIRAEGEGRLALKLDLPLDRMNEARIAGTFQFANNRILARPDAPAITDASGKLGFTESSATIENATAIVYGNPVTVNAAIERDRGIKVTAQGRVNPAKLRQHVDHPLLQRLEGETSWRGSSQTRNQVSQVSLETDLEGLQVQLPAPFGKRAEEKTPLKLEASLNETAESRWQINYGSVVSAWLARAERGLLRGTIHFGGAAPPPEKSGLWVTGSLPAVDYNQWQEVLDAVEEKPSGRAAPDVRAADLQLASVSVGGRKFTELRLSARKQDARWNAHVFGRQLEGDISWDPAGKGSVTARFAHLAIPAATGQSATLAKKKDELKKDELPSVQVSAESFAIGDKNFGVLELAASPRDQDWRIESLKLSNPDASFSAQGSWQPSTRRTQLTMKLAVASVEQLLARLNYPQGVQGGNATMEGTVSWNGAPHELDYKTLSGELALSARKGRFAQLKPGIGKLLGILSLQALPRRLQMDFKDIFSEGYSFDAIDGHLNLAQGMMSTQDLAIIGPAATIVMRGQVDLGQETQNLIVTIAPAISDSVALAALLANPAAGVAAYLLQKALRDPLGKLISYDYSITGTWSDPIVSKLKSRAAEAQQGEK
jgi:uncharacterized protein (TIGR02099 family)